jgi:hypothetical protein
MTKYRLVRRSPFYYWDAKVGECGTKELAMIGVKSFADQRLRTRPVKIEALRMTMTRCELVLQMS